MLQWGVKIFYSFLYNSICVRVKMPFLGSLKRYTTLHNREINVARLEMKTELGEVAHETDCRNPIKHQCAVECYRKDSVIQSTPSLIDSFILAPIGTTIRPDA